MSIKILVTSAAGKTGMYVVKRLIEAGVEVRALVRTEDHRCAQLRAWGAEVMVCNMYSITEMRLAITGCQRAYLCPPTAPNGLYFCNVFCCVAKDSELEHIVMLGQWLACEDHPSLFTREVWMGERLLEGLPSTHTIVNVGWFADNYFMVLEPAIQLGILPMPLGDGVSKSDVPPSTDDIASVVVGALLEPIRHAGKHYRPTGPALVSPNDVAQAIAQASGTSVKYSNISESMFLKALVALKPPNYSRAAVTQLKIYAEEYRRGSFAVGGPTKAVQEVGGKAPDSIEIIAQQMVANRPEAKRSFSNRATATKNFLKILLTPEPNIGKWSRDLDQVQISDGLFTQENPIWQISHA